MARYSYQFDRLRASCEGARHENKRFSRNRADVNRRAGRAAGAGLAKAGLYRVHDGAGAGLLGELGADQFHLLLRRAVVPDPVRRLDG